MLQSFKDRIRGSRWLGYTIVGIISVPFALWGIQAYMGGGGRTAAATVNGQEIPSRLVERRVAQQRQSLSERFGGELPDMFTDGMLRERVLEQLITRELLEQTARDANLRINEQTLARRIRGQSMFQREGEFSRELYRNVLSRSGLTVSQYEARVRDGARVEQLRGGITESSFVLDSEAKRLARLGGQERRVESLQLTRAGAKETVNVDDDAIRSYYESHAERFQRPEQVRLAYVELDIEALKQQVEVSEEALRSEYESAGQRYREAAARQAAHILIEVPDNGGEEAQQKALEQARELRKQVVEGDADFAELAREYSDDSGSARQGGDLGFVTRGMMAEPFEKALFGLDDDGSVSEPVRTQHGYHLIKLLDIREREQKPFSAVRDEIRDDIATRRAEERFYERVEVLTNTAYENPDGLEAVSDQTGLDVQRTEWVSRRSGEGIASNQAVRRAAFSDSVLQERRNSDVIELDRRRVVVVRVFDRREPSPRPLEAVRDQVREAVISERTDAALRDWSQSVLQQLKEGVAPAEIAEEGGARLVSHGWLARSSDDSDGALVDQAFGLAPPGDDDEPTYGATTLGDGARAVVLVRGVRTPEVDEQMLARTRDRRAQVLAESEFRAWLETLRAEADIERHERNGGQGAGAGGGG